MMGKIKKATKARSKTSDLDERIDAEKARRFRTKTEFYTRDACGDGDNQVCLGSHFYENFLQYFCATKVILKCKDDHYLYKLTKTLPINCEPNLSCLKKRAFSIYLQRQLPTAFFLLFQTVPRTFPWIGLPMANRREFLHNTNIQGFKK